MLNSFLDSMSRDELGLVFLIICAALLVFIVLAIVLASVLGSKNKKIKAEADAAIQSEAELEQKLKVVEEYRDFHKDTSMAKTLFVCNMSADVKTSLNAINAYVGLSKRHIGNQDEVINYIEKIDKNTHHLIEVINKVSEVANSDSMLNPLTEEPLDITEFTSDILNDYAVKAKAKGVRVHYIVKNVSNAKVIADKEKLSTALSNVVSNAVNFTSDGGFVKCTLEQKVCERLRYGMFEFTIEDNGCGMSPEYLEKIYDAFVCDKACPCKENQGAGLGMTVTKKDVEFMAGTIEIESTFGGGTKVVLSIPLRLRDFDEGADINDFEVDINALSNKTVLVVEDNDVNAQITKELLEENGLKVEIANDGMVAVEMIKNRLSKGNTRYYNFVLMDIVMPNMDGYETTSKIRSMLDPIGYHLPIIATTANGFEHNREKSLEAGMDAHLDKPIDIGQLLNTLSSFLIDE